MVAMRSRQRTSLLVTAIVGLAMVIFVQPALGASTNFLVDPGLNSMALLASDSLAAQVDPSYAGTGPLASTIDNGYAGEAITPSGLQISLAPAANGLTDASLPASAGGVPILVRHVAHSQAQLISVTDAIDADRATWNATVSGTSLSSWGPDYNTNKVVVHLTKYSAALGAAIEAKYGSVLVSVATDSVVYQPAVATRKNDTSPYHGSALLCTVAGTNCSGTICTAWFSVNAGPTSIDLTSGHCGSHTWINGTSTLGGTFAVAYPNKNLDAQEFSISSNQGYVFSGGTGATSPTRRVAGKTTSGAVGGLFCTDGYTDGEVCNVRIDSVNQTDCYDGQCTTGTVLAHQLNNIHAFSGGDSGGPVYNTQGDGSVLARGMIDANNASNPAYGAYTPIANITGNWNFTLRLG